MEDYTLSLAQHGHAHRCYCMRACMRAFIELHTCLHTTPVSFHHCLLE